MSDILIPPLPEGAEAWKIKAWKDHWGALALGPQPNTEAFVRATMPQYEVAWFHRQMFVACDKLLSGEWPRVMVFAPPGHGKPVYNGSMILLHDGRRVQADEIQVGDEVITHRGRGRAVTAVFEQGEIPCVRIKTLGGRETVAGQHHPFLTPNGFLEARHLTPGMTLANVARPTRMASAGDLERFRLVGYLIGDGSTGFTNYGNAINAKITCLDPTQRDDIRACVHACGFQIGQENDKDISIKKGVRDWLWEIGMAGKKSLTKRVPEFVFRGSQQQIANFLGAYFACDGSVNKRGNARPDACVEYYSSNRPLLTDTQHLLLRVGIQSRLSDKRSTRNNFAGGPVDSFRLTITSQDEAAKFKDRVPVYGQKGTTFREWPLQRQKFDAPYLPDIIASVENAGNLPCRCFTVEEDHTFTSDDFVVHNSEVFSRRFPAYALARNPDWHVLCWSHTHHLARTMGRDVQRIMEGEDYRNLFPGTRIPVPGEKQHGSRRRRSDTYVEVVGRQGQYYASGVGGAIMGRRFHLGIIDDPIATAEDALSATVREKVWQEYATGFATRQFPGARILLIMTRYHVDDLAGRLLRKMQDDPKSDQWRVLSFAAVKDAA